MKIFCSPEVKAAILAALDEGRKISRLGEGLPGNSSIQAWRKQDPEFDAAVAERLGRNARSPETQQRILAALREGRRLTTLGEGFPNAQIIRRWRAEDPDFHAEIVALLEEQIATTFSLTYKRSEELQAAIVDVLKRGGSITQLGNGFPTYGQIVEWRRADREFDRRIRDAKVAGRAAVTRSGHTRNEELEAAISEAVKAGKSILDLGESFPSYHVIYRWRRRNPEVDKAIRSARRTQRESLRPKPVIRPPSVPFSQQITRSSPLYAAANKAVSRGYEQDVRDDIISMIIMAALEGETKVEDIPRSAKMFVNRYWRTRDTFGYTSLDAKIGDGDGTLHDFLTPDRWAA